MIKFNASILDYLGKLDIGVLVLVSIIYESQYYEATFFYTQDQMVLTISEDLEEVIGHPIDKDPEYADLLSDILKRLIPFNEMYNRLDDVDFSKWVEYDEPESNNDEVEYLDIKEEDQNGSSS
jgi:hypothetical protein